MINKTEEAVECGDVRIGFSKTKMVLYHWERVPGPYQPAHILMRQHPRAGQKTAKALCGKVGVRISKTKHSRQALLEPSPLLCEACRQRAVTIMIEGEQK